MTTRAPGIRLAPDFTLPLECITETIAILGIRGSGKTTTAVAMTEDLLAAGQQVVIVDPTDVWYGLKSSADGRAAGYPVVVFGGRHADMPLHAGDGAAIADFVAEERVPAILSLRHFESQADMRRLVTDFARRLYHRKGEAGLDTPLMLVIDEAHLFCPQRVDQGTAPMVGAIQRLVRQGRASGLGVTVIDQRASSVNKDILTQLELLICHRTSSPQDRKALDAWVEQHDTAGRRGKFLEALASLPRGTAWCWSPGWLDLFRQVAVRPRRTFDSSATPKAGQRVGEPRTLAQVDLDQLRQKLSAQAERAKLEDPRQLRARIAELERAAAAKPTPLPKVKEAKPRTVPVLTAKDLGRLEREGKSILAAIDRLGPIVEGLQRMRTEVVPGLLEAMRQGSALVAWQGEVPPRVGTAGSTQTHTLTALPRAPLPVSRADSRKGQTPAGDGSLAQGERRILTALATMYPSGLERWQLTVIVGYKKSSRDTYLQRLRAAGHAEPHGERWAITTDGLRALGSFDPLPTGAELRNHWLRTLPAGEAKLLEHLMAMYPEPLDRETLSQDTGYKKSSRDTYLQRLRARELIDTMPNGQIRAAALLFG